MRRAARQDANHAAVRGAFRTCGCSVQDLSPVGDGCPDLLIGFKGLNFLVEVKDGSLKPSAQALTDDQVKWHAQWRGQVVIVRRAEDVPALLASLVDAVPVL